MNFRSPAQAGVQLNHIPGSGLRRGAIRLLAFEEVTAIVLAARHIA